MSLSMKTRLECVHSIATADNPDLFCDYSGKCDGELHECCLWGHSHTEEMRIIAENERRERVQQ